jgi:ribose/xylose/arabinose/galactoside ABC-type transport system permease subunit
MKHLKIKVHMIWIAVIIMYIISIIVNPATFTWMQIRNVMKIVPFLGIAALGHTIVVLVGGTDLSIAGIVTATVLITCRVMSFGTGSFLGALAYPILLGIGLGVIKGFIITKFKIMPLITTMAMNYIIVGSCLVLSGGATTGRVARSFQVLTDGYIFGIIPISVVIFMALAVLIWIMQTKTKFGYEIYATGSNPTAAYVNGVNTQLTIILAYVICSLCAVLTGFLLAAYIQIPSFDVGDPYATNSLAAVVIGGTLMTGGVGGVSGTVGGAIFMTLLNAFMNILRAHPGVQNIVRGSIIIIGIWISSGDMNKKIRYFFNQKLRGFSLKKT